MDENTSTNTPASSDGELSDDELSTVTGGASSVGQNNERSLLDTLDQLENQRRVSNAMLEDLNTTFAAQVRSQGK